MWYHKVLFFLCVCGGWGGKEYIRTTIDRQLFFWLSSFRLVCVCVYVCKNRSQVFFSLSKFFFFLCRHLLLLLFLGIFRRRIVYNFCCCCCSLIVFVCKCICVCRQISSSLKNQTLSFSLYIRVYTPSQPTNQQTTFYNQITTTKAFFSLFQQQQQQKKKKNWSSSDERVWCTWRYYRSIQTHTHTHHAA